MEENDGKRATWRSFEFASVSALAAVLFCLLIAQTAEQYAAQMTTQTADSAKPKPHFNVIDYATTATTKGATVIIGPCDLSRP